MNKLTEDQTINYLLAHLRADNWIIESHCLGQARGCDIVALKGKEKLMIEAKGAKASNTSPTKKRDFFDKGQIKTHFGVAIIKSLNDKNLYPDATIAIAHPDDISIRLAIGHLIPYLKLLNIKHFWVGHNGQVTEV